MRLHNMMASLEAHKMLLLLGCMALTEHNVFGC
jgi:hypothetical protein